VRVLIVEDDVALRKGLESAVRDLGHEARSVGTAGEAGRVIEDFDPEVLLVDVRLPDGDGIEVFRAARESGPQRDGIVVTGQASVDSAVEALRAGVSDYLLKPLRPAQLEVVFQRLADRRNLETEVDTLRAELQETGKLGDLIGKSAPMKKVFDAIRRVARSNAPVLITGQSGTGKEVVARTIHRLSRRASAPFVAFNCGAISPSLIESLLFGHERGAFTGAEKRHIGYFEEASGGTLLLDEITEMGPELQVKLLRVLEAKSLRRVGGKQELRVDVRIVSATNRDPLEAIESGKLREDLYYRLNVFPIALPPLSERREDVALLAEHFRSRRRRACSRGIRRPCGSSRSMPGRATCASSATSSIARM
jgi:two-component system response regulator AtoC